MKKYLTKINLEIALIILIIVIGAFLRLYHIELFGFANDQARDANTAQQILRGHLAWEGPQFSVDTGGERGHLGPFYFYFIAPAYLLFGGDPIGNILLIALLSIASIYLIYLVGRKYFNSLTGIISAVILCFSYYVLYHSRFPWNPNIMIFFVLLMLNYFHKAIFENEKYYLVVGILFGIITQIQASTFLFIPCFMIFFLFKLIKLPKLKILLYSAGLFVITYIPLIIYDVFHKFVNSKAYFQLLLGRSFTPGFVISGEFPFVHDFISYFNNMFGFSLGQEKYVFLLVIVLILTLGYLLAQKDKINKIFVIFTMFLTSTYALLAYKNPLQEYFFLTVTPFVVITISYLLAETYKKNIICKGLVFIVLILFIYQSQVLYCSDVLGKINRSYAAEHASQTLWPDIQESVNYMISYALKNTNSPDRTFEVNYQTCPPSPFVNNDAFDYAFNLKKATPSENPGTNIYFYIIQPPQSLVCADIDREKYNIVDQKQYGKIIILTGVKK